VFLLHSRRCSETDLVWIGQLTHETDRTASLAQHLLRCIRCRKTTATYPDNSVLNTAYCGAETLVTEPYKTWRKKVQRMRLAVGRSRRAKRSWRHGRSAWMRRKLANPYGLPPTATTSSNLTSVLQNGSRARSFSYDSLSRLLTSTNPEVGTITYTYTRIATS